MLTIAAAESCGDRSLRQRHKAVSVITQFGPCQFRQWMPRIERNGDGGESQSHTDLGPTTSKPEWNEELIISVSAVGGLHDVLSRTEFFRWIRVNTGVPSGAEPNAGRFELADRAALTHRRHGDFGALVGELVIELAPEQDAPVLRFELECEFGRATRLSPKVARGRINLPAV